MSEPVRRNDSRGGSLGDKPESNSSRPRTDTIDPSVPLDEGTLVRRLEEERTPFVPALPREPTGTGTSAVRPRIVIANRADGGYLYWIGKLYAFAALTIVALAALTLLLTYGYFSVAAPPVPDLERYANIAPGVSRIYAADGTVLGEFAKEYREIVPFERIPKPLVDAFLAVEDHEFFEHRGIYWKGIFRAAWRNVTAGDFAQGGSTITQQVAKQFLGNEKSLSRKGKEAVMARRLEAQYSKRAILAVYLNHIYLGAGAWGVSAAAHRYFKKDLDKLTLAECALIAGLAKAPTKYSPINTPKLAIDRRNIVLEKMRDYGYASDADVVAAKAEPIKLDIQKKTFPDRMPYYAEHVRRYATEHYGANTFGGGALRIEAAAEPTWEAAAYENVDFSSHHQDKRQGWRGPEWRLDGAARELFVARQRALYGKDGPLTAGKRYLALVDKVESERAEVLVGDRRLQLPLRNMQWAARWEKGNVDNDHTIGSVTQALKVGDVIWVQRETRTIGKFREWRLDKLSPSWVSGDDQHDWDATHTDVVKLDQVPHPQSTLFTADHHNGYVVAMVGGNDYDRTVFNRAVQACRQPGSTYKPIYYSLALDQGFGFDTQLPDVPMPYVDPDTGQVWTPTNLDNTIDYDVTLEYALVFSKNVPSVDLFRRLGAKNVEAWARRLGFTTKIFADDALALGASCSKLDEMARAYTVFARNGTWWPRAAPIRGRGVGPHDWVYVRRILDRDGNTIEDNTLFDDPQLVAADRFDRTVASAGVEAEQAIPARAAYLMSTLLAHEVQHGFATVIRQTQIAAGGKTGTSSFTHDTMFIGYTSRFTTLAWLGDDKKERALGLHDAAYLTTVPLWARYMYAAARGYPVLPIPWQVPPGVKKDDRGEHSKGVRVSPMDLYYRMPEKPPEAEDAAEDAAKDAAKRPPV